MPSKNHVEFRPLTHEDLLSLYGRPFPASCVGYAAYLGGEVIAAAGIAYVRPAQCFSIMKPEMKDHPRCIVDAIRLLREKLDSVTFSVFATPDVDEETAPGFLRHVGFVEIEEGVYQWPQQSRS